VEGEKQRGINGGCGANQRRNCIRGGKFTAQGQAKKGGAGGKRGGQAAGKEGGKGSAGHHVRVVEPNPLKKNSRRAKECRKRKHGGVWEKGRGEIAKRLKLDRIPYPKGSKVGGCKLEKLEKKKKKKRGPSDLKSGGYEQGK